MKKGALLLLAMLLAGCSGIWQPGAGHGGINLNAICDKPYPGDQEGGRVVGVFKCEDYYRLVFDSPGHFEYYITAKEEFVASCPAKEKNSECESMLKSCKFINLCRS